MSKTKCTPKSIFSWGGGQSDKRNGSDEIDDLDAFEHGSNVKFLPSSKRDFRPSSARKVLLGAIQNHIFSETIIKC